MRRYDGSQEVYQYNDQARLTLSQAANGAQIRHTYNEQGLRVSTTDALGQQTRYFYDDDGTLSAEMTPDGRITRYTYLDGQLKRMARGTGHLEQVWLNSINPQGDISAVRAPGEQITEYRYFPDGRVQSITTPDGVTQNLRWDTLGRLLEITASGGSVRHYHYSTLGTQPIAVTDEAGNTTQYVWDALGRLLEQTTPDGRTQQYRYNAYGKVIESRDPAGMVTRYEYAAPLHLLTRKILPDGSALQYRYDNAHLQVSEIVNAKGERYRLSYTATGLLSEEIGFDQVKTTYAYDLNDRLIEKREYGNQHDAEPLITTYQRDWQGKLLRKTLPDGLVEQYDYDALGRLIAVNDGQTPLVWEYDIADRLVAEHQGWGTQRHAYHPQSGLLSASQLPDGQRLDYHYQFGQVRGITLDGQPLLAFSHDSAGREQVRRQGNGLENRYQYDPLGRLTEHHLLAPGDDAPHTLWQQHYRYQAQGELAAIEGSQPREYHYDPLGQLLNVQFPGTTKPEERHSVAGESFQYDAAGNRLSQFEGEHAAPGNRLAFFGDRHFEYDRFGNLTVERRGTAHKLVTTFDYDCRHRLIKRTDPHGRVTTYAYDAFNRRTRKTVDGHITEYLWQGNKLIAETDNKSHWQTFLYEPDSHRPMATVLGSKRVNSQKVSTYWYQNDHLGTPHSLTDIRGNTVWKGRYSAYGQLLEAWTPPDDPYEHPQPKVNNPLRFQGQYEDPESGLHYNLNRYYDPGMGRYLTADPIGLRAGLNNYHYADSNPISFIDPLGLDVINTKTSTKPEPVGSANGQFSWDKYDDIPVLPEAGVGTYNYRGVHRGHPDADNNINGRIEPGDINSGITPELHNEGNVSGISSYTSWTRDPAIARSYAQTDGIILRVKAEAPKGNEKWSWEFSDDKYFEQEVLMQGIRDSGIEVFRP
ncbi:RHS repeat-associated core domain-containing protein [Serratia aquatilis]|uniref:RHS repeat-associated core domain-containing protein n=1 Tax=Serratia aquatilis TaxID=1737515 RepID=A0ABV6EHJ6_9GAMM